MMQFQRTLGMLLAVSFLPAIVLAQMPPSDNAPTPAGPPPRGSEENLEPIKKQLGCTDEEWKVIGPQLKKIVAAKRATEMAVGGSQFSGTPPFGRGPRGGPGGPGGRDSFAGPGGGGGPGPDGPPRGMPDRTDASQPTTQPARGGPPNMGQSPIAQATSELDAALKDNKSTPEQIQEKVAQVRAARDKAKAALAAAQKELAELLTPEQQAMLVSLDWLE